MTFEYDESGVESDLNFEQYTKASHEECLGLIQDSTHLFQRVYISQRWAFEIDVSMNLRKLRISIDFPNS